jgi:hypothetical protein
MSNAEWITDRRPTAADGDRDGDVAMAPNASGGRFEFIHWSQVGLGAPWQHSRFWQPPAEPAPTEPTPTEPDRVASRRVVQIAASTSLDLFALCDDGTIWINVSRSDWAELPAIPQP